MHNANPRPTRRSLASDVQTTRDDAAGWPGRQRTARATPSDARWARIGIQLPPHRFGSARPEDDLSSCPLKSGDPAPPSPPARRPGGTAAAPLAPAWGWRIADGGRAAHVTPGPEYQGTTTQLCGLYPFVAGSGTPTAGTPVGRHQLWGEVVCLDPLAWLRAGLVTNPGVFVLGQPGHRQVGAGQAAGHRRGRGRHPGADPRRRQTRLHPARPPPRRPGDHGSAGAWTRSTRSTPARSARRCGG